MAKKTFALEMNGIEIKTLEDLRENFNLEKAVEYFKSGELVDWLENLFYDDEVEKIEDISADDKNLSQKICAALDVECDEDLEFTQRVREKKKILAEKTDDENIIDNAMTTALNQDDLANLLHMDYPTIFLCGENFTVPIRVENKKYIGVLSTPKIKIKANSQSDLDVKNISFENCILPYEKSKIDELKSLVQKIFQNNSEFPVVDKNGIKISNYDKLDKTEKSLALKIICQEKYSEHQIVYMELNSDLTDGFALTTDSFCTYGNILKYNEIQGVHYKDFEIFDKSYNSYYLYNMAFFKNKKYLMEQVKKFLNIVKDF